MAQSDPDDNTDTETENEPLPTRDDGTTDYPGIVEALGLTLGDAYRDSNGDVYRYCGIRRADKPYADVTPLTHTSDVDEVRLDNLWWAYQSGDVEIGRAVVSFVPTDDE